MMGKNKADKQAVQWLKSMCQDLDSFNAINAENALNLIAKLKKQNRSLGAHFCNLKKQRNRLLKQQKEESETELLKAANALSNRMLMEQIAPFSYCCQACEHHCASLYRC